LKPKIFGEEVKKTLEIKRDDESRFRNFIKKFKKLPFVPIEVLIEVASGRIEDDTSLAKRVSNEVSRDFSLSDLQSLPHAKLNRITNSTSEGGEFYFEESIFFKSELYFLLAVEEKEIVEKLVQPALKLIQDWGLGGNRSIGFGSFSFKVEESSQFEELLNKKSDTFITLSPVIATDRIDYNGSFYNLETFKGAIDSGYQDFLWKPKIFYLKEGSCLKLKEEKRKFAGALFRISENVEVYQYGLEFPIYVGV